MTQELAFFLRRNLRKQVPHPTEDRTVRVEEVTRFHWSFKDGNTRYTMLFETVTPEIKARILNS